MLSVSLLSCTVRITADPEEKPAPKFKVGDIAYLKPDSTKCVITDVNFNEIKNYWQYMYDYRGYTYQGPHCYTPEYLFH